MNDIKYIPEKKCFIINGKVINESQLTPKQINEYKQMANTNWSLLTGNANSIKQSMILG